MITDNWLISKKLVSKIIFTRVRINIKKIQQMALSTHDTLYIQQRPLSAESELLEIITTKHVGTFLVQRRWRQRYRRSPANTATKRGGRANTATKQERPTSGA